MQRQLKAILWLVFLFVFFTPAGTSEVSLGTMVDRSLKAKIKAGQVFKIWVVLAYTKHLWITRKLFFVIILNDFNHTFWH